MKYAYIGKGNILHIVEDKNTALEYSINGKVLETDFKAELGYPVVDNEGIVVYSETEMKKEANGKEIGIIPELAEIYKNCK